MYILLLKLFILKIIMKEYQLVIVSPKQKHLDWYTFNSMQNWLICIFITCSNTITSKFLNLTQLFIKIKGKLLSMITALPN
jgi:hypothetical protein